MTSRQHARRLMVDAVREAGVLILAFAPLDGAFNRGTGLWRIVIGFIVLGMVLFTLGLVMEGGSRVQ